MLRRVCHSYSTELSTQSLIKRQFQNFIYCLWSKQLMCIHLHRW